MTTCEATFILQVLRDAGRLSNTLLALTKSDLIQDGVSIVEHIFDRVLGSSPEIRDLCGLAGCVAVANRISQDRVTLLEAEAAEQAVFASMFKDPAEASVQLQCKSSSGPIPPQTD